MQGAGATREAGAGGGEAGAEGGEGLRYVLGVGGWGRGGTGQAHGAGVVETRVRVRARLSFCLPSMGSWGRSRAGEGLGVSVACLPCLPAFQRLRGCAGTKLRSAAGAAAGRPGSSLLKPTCQPTCGHAHTKMCTCERTHARAQAGTRTGSTSCNPSPCLPLPPDATSLATHLRAPEPRPPPRCRPGCWC